MFETFDLYENRNYYSSNLAQFHIFSLTIFKIFKVLNEFGSPSHLDAICFYIDIFARF